jgi:hypothetical protein
MQKLQGYVEKGNTTITISGGAGTVSQKVQGSFPSATVTVYAAGTTNLSTIYSDNAVSPTAKANPFTANSDGSWFFYASDGRYDVKFSGTGIDTPFTLGDFQLSGAATGSIFYNVRDYGAVGDDSTNDAASIQSAADDASSNEGYLMFPPGTYLCNDDIDIGANTHVIGTGTVHFSGNYGFNMNNADLFSMRDITIQGASGGSQTGIYIHNTTARWKIENVKFEALQFGIYATNTWIGEIHGGYMSGTVVNGIKFERDTGNCSRGTAFGPINDITIHGDLDMGCSGVCIWLGDYTNNSYTNAQSQSIYISGVSAEGSGTNAIILENTIGVDITGNYFEGTDYGIVLQGYFNYAVNINANQFWGDGATFTDCIWAKEGGANIFDLSVTNNSASNTVGGFTGAAALKRLTYHTNYGFGTATIHSSTAVNSSFVPIKTQIAGGSWDGTEGFTWDPGTNVLTMKESTEPFSYPADVVQLFVDTSVISGEDDAGLGIATEEGSKYKIGKVFTMRQNDGADVGPDTYMKVWKYTKNLDDDTSVTLFSVFGSGRGRVVIGTVESAVFEYCDFIVDSAGDVTLLTDTSANVVANADTDGNLCIGTAASQEPLLIKNRLGETLNIVIDFIYN